MIVFFEYGRLGNQLFQYSALKELYPKHCLVLFGFGDLKRAIEATNAIIIEKGKLPKILFYFLQSFFSILSRLRIIGSISELNKNGDYSLRKINGLVWWIYLLKPSNFQHKEIIKKINPKFKIQEKIINSARNWLEGHEIHPFDVNLVFVHIRRDDYLRWPDREFPAVLNKKWYLKSIEKMRSVVSNPIFILVTDDVYYAQDCFSDLDDVVISANDYLTDFALMSLCPNGILSASSFAWWGAWFSKTKIQKAKHLYIAPQYWAGLRKKKWYPSNFATDWMTYAD